MEKNTRQKWMIRKRLKKQPTIALNVLYTKKEMKVYPAQI